MSILPSPSSPAGRALLRRAGITLVGSIVVVAVASIAMLISMQGRALPNTSVDGIPVGRMDRAALERTLAPIAARRVPPHVVLLTPGSRLVLGPERSGVHIDLEATIASALQHGRTGGPGDVIASVRALRVPQDIPFAVALDADAVAAWVSGVAEDFDRVASVGDLSIDPLTREVRILGPEGAQRILREETTAALVAALRSLADATVDLAFEAEPPPAPRSAIEELGEHVRTVLSSPPVLVHDGRRLVIDPTLLARAIRVVEGRRDGEPVPLVRIELVALPPSLVTQARSIFERVAIDARFVVPQEPPSVLDALDDATFEPLPVEVDLDPGQSLVHVVPARLARQLERMVNAGSTLATAELFDQPATFDGETARRGRPTHLVGTFTTSFSAGATRNLNIARLAGTLDGTIVAPGDELSVNAISGPRSCEDGYEPAGTIVRGELVDTCGGGVSQFGTTIYNAAFFAGLPIPQWQAHSFFISRYPTGREATLSYPELDVRFVNDSDGFLIVRTSTTATSVTVSLYGIPRYAAISAIRSAPRDPTPYGEIERATTELPVGVRRVIQAGGGGFTVDVHRVWTALPGGEAPDPERAVTVYRPQQRIIEIGVPPGLDPTLLPVPID